MISAKFMFYTHILLLKLVTLTHKVFINFKGGLYTWAHGQRRTKHNTMNIQKIRTL